MLAGAGVLPAAGGWPSMALVNLVDPPGERFPPAFFLFLPLPMERRMRSPVLVMNDEMVATFSVARNTAVRANSLRLLISETDAALPRWRCPRCSVLELVLVRLR